MFLLYLLKNKKISRVVQVLDEGKSLILEVENEIIGNAAKLKTFLLGNQIFADLNNEQIMKWLRSVGRLPEVEDAPVLGFNKDAGAFFWTNKVLKDGAVIEPNEYGIVELDGISFFMPYSENVLQSVSDKHIAENISRFEYDDTATMTFNQWFTLLNQAFLDKSVLMAAFMVMSCFRDIIYTRESFTPTLFFEGEASSGKSASAKIICKCWGKKPPEVSLSGKTNTDKSIPTLLSQVSNAPVMLNEWSEDMSESQKRVIQGVWDGAGYHKATISGGTESVDINSTLILTSNDVPSYEPFFTRQVFVEMNETTFTPQQVEAFNTLQSIENMCSVSREILSYRQAIEKEYVKQRKENKAYIADVFRQKNLKIAERYIDNMAVLITPICILIMDNAVNLGRETTAISEVEYVREIAINNIINQTNAWEKYGGLKEYFDNLRFAIDKGKAVEIQDYMLKYDKESNKEIFCIKKPNFYLVYKQVAGNNAKSKNTITGLIAKSPYLVKSDKNVNFKNEKGKWSSAECYRFDYQGIKERYGFDLSKDAEIF